MAGKELGILHRPVDFPRNAGGILYPGFFRSGVTADCFAFIDHGHGSSLQAFAQLFQFTLFLVVGIMLYSFYLYHPEESVPALRDRIFPTFVVRHLPHGVSGLMIAAILAAAMSNLSSSLNSLASTTVDPSSNSCGEIARPSERLYFLIVK